MPSQDAAQETQPTRCLKLLDTRLALDGGAGQLTLTISSSCFRFCGGSEAARIYRFRAPTATRRVAERAH